MAVGEDERVKQGTKRQLRQQYRQQHAANSLRLDWFAGLANHELFRRLCSDSVTLLLDAVSKHNRTCCDNVLTKQFILLPSVRWKAKRMRQ